MVSFRNVHYQLFLYRYLLHSFEGCTETRMIVYYYVNQLIQRLDSFMNNNILSKEQELKLGMALMEINELMQEVCSTKLTQQAA